MDRISEIVERAVLIAEVVQAQQPEKYDVFHEIMNKLAREMRLHAPHHPALARLERFLAASETGSDSSHGCVEQPRKRALLN